MRKLLILFLSCVLLVVINFALWFYHTRVINEVLASLKENLSKQGIVLSYGEVLFSTFKYWDVQGSIDNFKIGLDSKAKNDPIKISYAIDKLYFESQPLSARLLIHTGSERRIFKNTSNIDMDLLSSPQTLEIKNSNSFRETLEIEFFDSVSQMLKIGSNDHKKPNSSIVKNLNYLNEDIITTDLEKKQDYSYIKNIKLNYKNDLSNNGYVYKVLVNMGGLRFNEHYPFNNEIQTVYKDFSFFEPEGITFNMDVSLDQYQSPVQVEFYKNADNNKNLDLKPIFDSFRYNFNDVSYNSKTMKFEILGQLNFENVESSGDVKIQFYNYKKFFDSFAKAFNYRLTTEPQSMAFGLKEISSDDLKHIDDFLGQFVKDNTLTLNITKKKEDSNFMVSERDAKTVFYDFLKVLYTATKKYAPDPAESGAIKPLELNTQPVDNTKN